MSLLGSIIGGGLSLLGQKSEQEMQKDFAQKGIQWRVKDATKAGVHPLFALGAQTTSYQPVGVGSSLGEMGQGIGRAAEAAMNPGEKVTSLSRKVADLQLERAGLENEKLRAEIRLTNQAGSPPSAPGGAVHVIEGQGSGKLPVPDPDAFPMVLKVPRGDGQSFDWQTSPTTNSQTVADQYGDAAQEVYGMWRLANDAADYVSRNVEPRLSAFYSDWARYLRKLGLRPGGPKAPVGRFYGGR